jgi:catechol 2,3-dioxygenase-like lactoylglutathione lyase family enzyme
MLDHISVGVSDFGRGAAFYDRTLASLAWRRVMSFGEAVGYGPGDHPVFWIGAADGAVTLPPGMHIAFHAPDRAAVDAFHDAAMKAGGRDNGAPGLRPHYHANYYAAFVTDPDGYHLEAVCHGPS